MEKHVQPLAQFHLEAWLGLDEHTRVLGQDQGHE